MDQIQSYILQSGAIYVIGVYVMPAVLSTVGVAMFTRCCLSTPTAGASEWCSRSRILALALGILLNFLLAMIGPFLNHYSLAQVQHGNREIDIRDHNCDQPSFTEEMRRTCNDLHAQNELSPLTHALVSALDAARKSFIGVAIGIILLLGTFWWTANHQLVKRAQLQAKRQWEDDFSKRQL